jgi:hypothetical protein
MIFQSPIDHHIENLLMFCHKAGLQGKHVCDASSLWDSYVCALENLQGRKTDGRYQAVNLIVSQSEASAFCKMLSTDALSLLDDRNQDQVISHEPDPQAQEKATLLVAAMECLGALSRQHKHLFDLLITDIFLMPSKDARGGSTSSAIGVIWANPKATYRIPRHR